MNVNKLAVGLMTILSLSLAPAAYAADNGTEFGIEDDLSVLGTGGTWADPDAEIKGFTVVGPLSGPQVISGTSGNMVLRGNLQADATAYFGSSVTVAGYGVFQSTVQFQGSGSATNLYFTNAAANSGKVLKATSDGFLSWEADNNTTMTFATPYRLQMVNTSDDGLVDTVLLQNAAGTGVTVQTAAMGAASMTVTGAFGAVGTATFNDAVNLGDGAGDAITAAGAVTAQNGVTVSGGGLSVTGGNATVTNDLTVSGGTQLGSDTADTNAVNKAAEAGVALAVAGGNTSGNYAAKFYSGADLSAWIKKK